MTFLTQTPQAINFKSMTIIGTPDISNTSFQVVTDPETTECLITDDSICNQLWEIHVQVQQCPPDLSGIYSLQWSWKCANPETEVACQEFANQNSDKFNSDLNIVSMDVSVDFTDELCDETVYGVYLTDDTSYFYNDSFTKRSSSKTEGITPKVLSSPTYIPHFNIGDTVYVEFDISYPGNGYDISNAKLINLFVCTTNDTTLDVDNLSGEGGCMSDLVDQTENFAIFFDGQPVGKSNSDDIDGSGQSHARLLNDTKPNAVQCAFTMPKVSRDIVYVHAQMELALIQLNQNIANVNLRLMNANMVSRRLIDGMDGNGVDVDAFAKAIALPKESDRIGHFVSVVKVGRLEHEEHKRDTSWSWPNIAAFLTMIALIFLCVMLIFTLTTFAIKARQGPYETGTPVNYEIKVMDIDEHLPSPIREDVIMKRN